MLKALWASDMSLCDRGQVYGYSVIFHIMRVLIRQYIICTGCGKTDE